MAYFIKKSTLNKRVYLQIADGVYNPATKNAKQTVYKKLGYLDDLKLKYQDPIAFFKEEVDRLNAKRKETIDEKIPERTELLDLGYFPLERMYKELFVKSIVNGYQALRERSDQFRLSDVFESLVYARVLHPDSKSDTFDNYKDSLFTDFNYSKSQMYSAIELLGEGAENIFEGIQDSISGLYRRSRGRVYFDCTNYYFEIDRPSSMARPGPSKEERSNPIIGLGLLLDGDSIPLDYRLYPGNESEKPVFRDILKDMKEKNRIKGRVIRIADKGLNCGDNIADAYYNGDGYIFSQTVKGASKEIKEWILDPRDYKETTDASGVIIYKIKSYVDDKAEIAINNSDGKKQKVTISQKQIVFWSKDFADKAAYERDKALNKLEKSLNYESLSKKERYGFAGKYVDETIVDGNGEVLEASKVKQINKGKVSEDASLDGYYMIVTSEVKASDDEILDAYRTLWEIEESFRITKTTLRTRPVYHSKENAIKGHFLICMTSLLLLRMIQKKKLNSKMPVTSMVDSLRKYKCVEQGNNKYQLVYIDKNLKTMARYYSLKLNQHFKTKKEIEKLF